MILESGEEWRVGRLRPVELATVHALTWLGVACGIGLLLAILLLAPGLGRALGPLTYGRWMPLHLDLVLYGWTALPLVALLFRVYLPREGSAADRLAVAAVHVWSGSLAAGAVAWLAGQVTAKPFLDWQGGTRAAFLLNLVFLAAVLAVGLAVRMRTASPRPSRLAGLGALWVGLLGVIAALALATSTATYPPVNPDTGGPTGASLLGSTLGVIVIFAGTPLLLGLAPRVDGRTLGWAAAEVFGALGLHGVLFALISLSAQGDHSHREPLQIAAVATLLVWAWLLPRWLRRFAWPEGSRPWLLAFLLWGGALLATAVPMFLPGLLDRIKFTNALVSHSHLAMAGMATNFVALLLVVLNDGTRLRGLLGDRVAFWLWNAGNAVHVTVLAFAGLLEGADPGIVFRGDPSIALLYGLRALAGGAMLAAVVRWLARAARVAGRPA